MLGKADEFYVSPFNIPAGEQLTAPTPEPPTAHLSAAERAADRIHPRDLCTHPTLGGRYSCEYGQEWHVYADGMKEVWVVGADRQVYHRYSRPDGSFVRWQPFGGVATSGVELLLDESEGQAAVVRVRGTDGKYWYRERNGNTGKWTGWHLR